MSLLRHGVVSRSDWPFPHLRHSATNLYTQSVSQTSFIHSAWRRKDANPRLFRARLLRNILHDVVHSLHKGRSCQSLRRKIQTVWAFGLRWLFGDYHFLVLQLATSLKMAVSTRAEKSPALPPYQSPRRHDSKNSLHIPAYDTIFCCLLQGCTK